MKKRHRKTVNFFNNREERRQAERKREQERKKKIIDMPSQKKEMLNVLNGILSEMYTVLIPAVNKNVTSKMDREALIEEIDKIFGKKEKDSKIVRV